MNTKKWMATIADSKLISEITIPGTHDSATYTANDIDGLHYVKTQSLSITDQLNIGCRFLDIRAREFNNTLVIHHGAFFLHLNFEDILNDCRNFLKDNPSETILMSVKDEYEPENNSISYEQAFLNYYNIDLINKNNKPVNTLWYTQNLIPKLGDVRGKIVLLRRFSLDNNTKSLGINMSFRDNQSFKFSFQSNPKQTLVCEDLYNPKDLSEKLEAIKKNGFYVKYSG